MVHSRAMKIVIYSMEPCLRASPSHSGQGFFELFVTDPPQGRPFGSGGDHRKGRSVKKNLESYQKVQFSWEMLNYEHSLRRGFTSAAVAPMIR